MTRNKEQTKQQLIDAVGSLMVSEGYTAVGVNAIAREANLDKVLIYRYFNGLDGLLAAFAEQQDYFTQLDTYLSESQPITSQEEALAVSKAILIGQLDHVIHNPALQEILLWELYEQNPVTEAIAEKREQQGVQFMQQIEQYIDFSQVDFPAIGNLLWGGIYYLILRSRSVQMFNGINLQTDAGWQRTKNALHQLFDIIADSLDTHNEN